jgi:hypothetical protein
MHLFGLVALSYMWARIAQASITGPSSDAAKARLTIGKYFLDHMLPETGLRLARITAGADTMMALPAELF